MMTAGCDRKTEERFKEIVLKKHLTDHMALHMVPFGRFEIVYVGHRWRTDLATVVSQMHKEHTIERSDYAKWLWKKSCFK
ncbi:hypothetical protein [Macrococcus bovicus]|uniref:hypothetical protein n=1 Tax=Macrococcus bovicus TaxID=69968 RepID=UPI0025A66D46|nr:hypothetical protein [Macrococcus bovicus]WJP96717.1 hypothetical protein QSV55_00325 [Macrococcus bovicus]